MSITLLYQTKLKIISTTIFSVLYLIGLIAIMQVDHSHSHIFQIVDNGVLLITGIWLMRRGIQDSISHYFFLGVFTILLTGLLRYIDFVGDYVGAAILFAVFALILLSSAKYWKLQRSKVWQTS